MKERFTPQELEQLMSDERFVMHLTAFRLGTLLLENPSDENRKAYEDSVEAIRTFDKKPPTADVDNNE
jgi:hypothetical protein